MVKSLRGGDTDTNYSATVLFKQQSCDRHHCYVVSSFGRSAARAIIVLSKKWKVSYILVHHGFVKVARMYQPFETFLIVPRRPPEQPVPSRPYDATAIHKFMNHFATPGITSGLDFVMRTITSPWCKTRYRNVANLLLRNSHVYWSCLLQCFS